MASVKAVYACTYSKIWDDGGTHAKPYDATFFRAIAPVDYFPVGDIVERGQASAPTTRALILTELPPAPSSPPCLPALTPPLDFIKLWENSAILKSSRQGAVSFWQPVPPEGYVALGTVVIRGFARPPLDLIRCVRHDFVVQGTLDNDLPRKEFPGMHDTSMMWSDRRTGCKGWDVSCWKVSS